LLPEAGKRRSIEEPYVKVVSVYGLPPSIQSHVLIFQYFGNTVLCMCLILLFGICSLLFQIELLTPKDYIGPIMELGQERRGEFKEMNYITENRAKLIYMLPLAEV
jgi:translation elongation factor EF-G